MKQTHPTGVSIRAAFMAIVVVLVVLLADTTHAGATIIIRNNDAPGEGFNDLTPWVSTGGNPAITLGQARLNSFQYAAGIWGSLINSDVEITVLAQMDELSCTPLSAMLGAAGTITIHTDFIGAPRPRTWYPQALANALMGSDLAPIVPEIQATFNSNLNGDPSCLQGLEWYYGFDKNPPDNDIDFISVLVHELGHGLGFATYVNLVTGGKLDGLNDTYMVNLDQFGATPSAYPMMNNTQRIDANTSDPNLRWIGPAVTAAYPGTPLTDGTIDDTVRVHAPAQLQQGSSVSHWSDGLSPNEIMEPFYTEPLHDVGLARWLMKDIGWELDPMAPGAFAPVIASPANGAIGVFWRLISEEAFDGFNVYRKVAEQAETRLNANGLIPIFETSFIDNQVEESKAYRYSVAAVRPDGSEERSVTTSASIGSPQDQ